MAGAAQLIARLQAHPVPSVPSPENLMEPLEAAPAVAVPSVPSVPSEKHQGQGESRGDHHQDPKGWKGSRDLPFRESSWNRWNQPAPLAPAAEPQRNAWTITRGGKPICRMVGAPCTRTEALADARWRWPDADILEN